MTPLHNACSSFNVTNLDFVELLLKKGADPSALSPTGQGQHPPLMFTFGLAPGAAKFLLNWPATDANIISQSGASFLARVRLTIKAFSYKVALLDNPEEIQHQFLLQQWRDIETILVERGAIDTGITNLE
jgi:hypothetical protein